MRHTGHMEDTLSNDVQHQGEGPVTLHGHELAWKGVSPSLTTARTVTVLLFLLPAVVGTIVLGVLVTRWAYIGTGVLVVLGVWATWLIARQVSAMSWIELPDELVIRKGRLFRSLVSIPYGRLQVVNVASGPLMRRLGLASCEVHTASPVSRGSLPGLTTSEAEELRARLAARGETQRAGL